MRSTFGGLSIASTGLAAQRRALEVAGHNVANANTAGYSRQRVDMGAISGGSSMIHTGPAVYGGGTSVLGVNRIVDQFLIQRSNTETASKGTTDTIKQTLSRIEASFNEPGENGLASQLEAYWDAWDSVAATPEDLAARSALIQRGIAIGDTFQTLDRTFDLMTSDVLGRADALTADINAIARQVASLNESIASAMDGGTPPNDLLDQRDELVRTLSSFVGVTTRVDDRGRMDINVGGVSIVSGARATALSLDTSDPDNAVLRSAGSNVAIVPQGGQMDGLLQSANMLIPQQKDALEAVTVRLMEAVNTQHYEGMDLQTPPQSTAGVNFFVITAAGDLTVNPDLVDDPARIGAAGDTEGRFGNANARAMAELGRKDGSPDEAYRSMMASLGVSAQTANRRSDLQNQLTREVDRQREEVSGVSIDEEMANLVAYQQAYHASARFMTAIDEMLSTLMSTGLVGR